MRDVDGLGPPAGGSVTPCVYCRAAWPDPDVDLVHLPSCPSLTNLYPVTERDLRPHGFACTECDHQFQLGESYTTLPLAGVAIVEVVCLDCAAATLATT